MTRRALGHFEQRQDGGWVCTRAGSIRGCGCMVDVRLGQTFAPGTAFAGYDDFTGYLASVGDEESCERA